jgi:hypothetical protein
MRAKILFSLLGAVCVLWGAELWDRKPYTDWSWQEVNKVLTASPWSRAVQVIPDLNRMREAVPPGMLDRETVTLMGGERSGGQLPTMLPTTELLVRWHSSLTVRQAMARGQFGDKAGNSARVAEFLARPQKSYVITVSRVPSRFFEDKTSPQLRTALAESATLRVKGLKEMKPRDIQLEVDGKVLTVFFAFPRDQAILLKHNEAEFAAHIGPLKVNSSFKLAKMIRGGKLDL